MRADVKGDDLGNGMTMWSLAGVATVMPSRKPTWSTALLEAYDRRVEANLVGQCACSAVIDDVKGAAPRMAHGAIVHENDCPATDENFIELMKRGGGTA